MALGGVLATIKAAVAHGRGDSPHPNGADTDPTSEPAPDPVSGNAGRGAKTLNDTPSGRGNHPSTDAKDGVDTLAADSGKKPTADDQDRIETVPPSTRANRPVPNPNGVVRSVIAKDDLNLIPSLHGNLDPPTAKNKDASKPPAGVEVSKKSDGTRVVTINIHQAVPIDPDIPREDRLARQHQSIDALRDVAAYVNSVDADIVAVQEVNDHADEQDGVPYQASVLYHLLGADEMAFTPAMTWSGGSNVQYGTATYTRNGYDIRAAHNVDLPNAEGELEDRSAGVMSIVSPEGERMTFVNTHLTQQIGDTELDSKVRGAQIRQIAGIVKSIQDDGEFTYRDALDEDMHTTASWSSAAPIVIAGDFNTKGSVDNDGVVLNEAFGDVGLADTQPDDSDEIDHIFTSTDPNARATIHEIPGHKVDRDAEVTDHPALSVDL